MAIEIIVDILLRGVIHGHQNTDQQPYFSFGEKMFAELMECNTELLVVYAEQWEGVCQGCGVIVKNLGEVMSSHWRVGEGENPASQVSSDCGEAHVWNLHDMMCVSTIVWLLYTFKKLTRLIAAQACSSVI